MGMSVTLEGDWKNKTEAGRRIARLMDVKIGQFLIREAEIMRMLVGHSFAAQGTPRAWQKLSKWTIANRRLNRFGGTKALIWSGEMRKSISTSYDPNRKASFCGIKYKTKAPDGKSMVNLAKLHEYGSKKIAIRITPRMRRFLFVLAKFLPRGMRWTKRNKRGHYTTGIIVIQIPPRPFMGPQKPVFALNAERRARAFFKGFMLGV